MRARLLKIPELIDWHDGMLLTPQHFDELTVRLESLIDHAAVTSTPFNWGVLSLRVGTSELLEGVFAVSELEAILPDGMAVWHDESARMPLSLDLGALDPSFRAGTFMVYAAVPAAREGANRTWRYESAEPARDEQAAVEEDDDAPIPRLRPKLTLIASQTPPASRFSSLPLARMQFTNGSFERVDAYQPPARLLRAESNVVKDCAALLRRVREVAVLLQQQWRSLSSQARENMDLARRGAVQQLVAVLPYSEALLESGEQQPFQIYLALCSLAGHLASIATDPIPPSFSRYNHLDIAASFSEVLGYLRKIIQENSSENYTGIPFLHGDNAYYVMFEPSWKGRKLILAMRTGNIPRQDVVTWGEQAVIASSILQDSMRERRMLGARRVQIEREPGLFSGPEVVLFHLTNDNQFIQGGEMLEVGGGPSSRPVGEPVEMTLYVMQN